MLNYPFTRSQLSNMNRDQLRTKCSQHNYRTFGSKQELQERLLNGDHSKKLKNTILLEDIRKNARLEIHKRSLLRIKQLNLNYNQVNTNNDTNTDEYSTYTLPSLIIQLFRLFTILSITYYIILYRIYK
jgi:hypothetical protein